MIGGLDQDKTFVSVGEKLRKPTLLYNLVLILIYNAKAIFPRRGGGSIAEQNLFVKGGLIP